MSRRRRIVAAALVAFAVAACVLSFLPSKWHSQIASPVPKNVTYTCGAAWGAAYAHGPVTTLYRAVGKPCGERRTYQIVGGVDVLFAAAGLVVLARWGRERLGEATPA